MGEGFPSHCNKVLRKGGRGRPLVTGVENASIQFGKRDKIIDNAVWL